MNNDGKRKKSLKGKYKKKDRMNEWRKDKMERKNRRNERQT